MDLAPLLLIIVVIILIAIGIYLLRHPEIISVIRIVLPLYLRPRPKSSSKTKDEMKKALEEIPSWERQQQRPPMNGFIPNPSRPVAKPIIESKPQPTRGESAKTAEESDDGFAPAEPEPVQQEQGKPGAAILDDLLTIPEETARTGKEDPPKPTPPSRPQSPITSTDTFGGVPPVESPSGAADVQPVQVSAYYPKEVKPTDWQAVHAYMFRQSASDFVSDDAAKQLGARKTEFRVVGRTAGMPVQEGALVVATPSLPGFEFNPPTAQIRFYKDWHRFDFEARTKDAPLNQSTNGFITFTVEGIIIADVPISIYVGESVSQTAPPIMTNAKLYQAIFCSYSHQDTPIVERAERVYKALGLDFLRDVMSLKSGQEWSDECSPSSATPMSSSCFGRVRRHSRSTSVMNGNTH